MSPRYLPNWIPSYWTGHREYSLVMSTVQIYFRDGWWMIVDAFGTVYINENVKLVLKDHTGRKKTQKWTERKRYNCFFRVSWIKVIWWLYQVQELIY